MDIEPRPQRRGIPILRSDQELERVDSEDAIEVYRAKQQVPGVGTVELMLDRYSRQQVKEGGEFGDGYVLGESEVLDDVDAFEKGLFLIDIQLANIIHVGNQDIRLELFDSANNITYTAALEDARDTLNPEESTSRMSVKHGEWERREDPLGEAKLFVPNEPAVLRQLHMSLQRTDRRITQGGENQL